jgi:glycosyltransferase involved in cell wall biosynthesis
MKSACELSVVIPALDEGASIGELVRRVGAEAMRLGVAHEVIVVDGGSTDGTPRWAAEAGATVVRQPGRGYADALMFGLRQAQGDYVASMDADYSHDPDFLRAMWAARDDAELVIASRYVAGGFAYMPAFRRLLSRILNRASRSILALPVRDLSSGFRLYHRKVLPALAPRARRFDVLIEILARIRAEGWRIKEVPFHYRQRQGGRSHAGIVSFGLAYAGTLARMWALRNSLESADYDDRAFNSRIPIQRFWQRRRYAIVLGMLGHADAVLDVGCGSSKILEALPHAVGLDLNFKPLRFRRQTNRLVVNGDVHRLPFHDDAFDAVICSEMLEHVPFDSRIFTELSRVLRPGGTLVVGTPDYGRWQWPFIEWWYTRLLPGAHGHDHVQRYTESTLRSRLLEFGFEPLQAESIWRAELILKCTKRASPTPSEPWRPASR